MASPTSPSQQLGSAWGDLPLSPYLQPLRILSPYQVNSTHSSHVGRFQREINPTYRNLSHKLVQFKTQNGESIGFYYSGQTIHTKRSRNQAHSSQAARFSRSHSIEEYSSPNSPFFLSTPNPKKKRELTETSNSVTAPKPTVSDGGLYDKEKLATPTYQARIQKYLDDIRATRERIRSETVDELRKKSTKEHVEKLERLYKLLQDTNDREAHAETLLLSPAKSPSN
ncbi:hypothetical protein [Parashewanella tropica]|uniref:hypothetical protein n=1 Tax=Parashewanella tropica TaxID=2547970 RepID=UPI001059F7F1|nr:hypothetical protein [Parashewanella tropica]